MGIRSTSNIRITKNKSISTEIKHGVPQFSPNITYDEASELIDAYRKHIEKITDNVYQKRPSELTPSVNLFYISRGELQEFIIKHLLSFLNDAKRDNQVQSVNFEGCNQKKQTISHMRVDVDGDLNVGITINEGNNKPEITIEFFDKKTNTPILYGEKYGTNKNGDYYGFFNSQLVNKLDPKIQDKLDETKKKILSRDNIKFVTDQFPDRKFNVINEVLKNKDKILEKRGH